MPTYTYKCRECERKFSLEATVSEKEEGLDVSCPHCGSEDVFQSFDRVGVVGASGGGSSEGCAKTSCPADRSCCG